MYSTNIHQYRVQILTWGQNIHCRWAVVTQPWRREGQAHQRYGYKNRCHTKCDRHPRVHLHFTNSTHNSTGWTPSMPKNIIITGWLSTKDELHSNKRPYWSYRDDLAVIDRVVIKGRWIIVPAELKQQVLDQLHLNHMGIKKQKLLMHESVYWVNINTDIEK